METKINKVWNIFEKAYFYTIGAIIAICVAWGIYDAVKIAFVSAPWFWIFLGLGTLYVIVWGFIIYGINKLFQKKA